MVNFIQIPEERRARVKSTLLKVGTFIGGIFLAVLLIWGAVSAASYASKRAQDLASRETLEKKQEETSIASGKPFILSWSHLSKSTDGFYTVSYPCMDGFFLNAETEAQGKQVVYCNSAFRSITSGNEIALTASSTKLREVELPLTISFTKNGKNTPKKLGVIEVKVINNAIPALATSTASTTPPNSPTSTAIISGTGSQSTGGTSYIPPATTPGQTTSRTYNVNVPGTGTSVNNPNGKPDLHPRILQVGYIDSSNNFIPSDTVSRNQRVAVRFVVENLGNKESGIWRFNAILPTYPSYTFNSESQVTMLPGDKVEFTLGFDRIVEGTSIFRIEIDGGNLVIESNESDNNISINIKAL